MPPDGKSINSIIGNAKRFLAYEIIKRLEAQAAGPLLQELHVAVKKREGLKGQIHKVFEESFDDKECFSLEFIKKAGLHTLQAGERQVEEIALA